MHCLARSPDRFALRMLFRPVSLLYFTAEQQWLRDNGESIRQAAPRVRFCSPTDQLSVKMLLTYG
jgi:hypothetical protein